MSQSDPPTTPASPPPAPEGGSPPAAPPPPLSHAHQVELLISYILRVGVIVSLLVIVTGMVMTFVNHPDYRASPEAMEELTRSPVASNVPHSIPQIIAGLRQGRGRAVVMLGLLLLVATPVTRVAVSIVIFVVERDHVFTVVTTVVLILLLLSFVLGRAGG